MKMVNGIYKLRVQNFQLLAQNSDSSNYDIACSLILAAITLHGLPWELLSTKDWSREPAVLLSEWSCEVCLSGY